MYATPAPATVPLHGHCRLRFQSLFHQGRALAFPCDEHGDVELDALSERARSNYLYARAVIGREFAQPTIEPDEDWHD